MGSERAISDSLPLKRGNISLTPHHLSIEDEQRKDEKSSAGAPEIKVTPEMIEAGLGPLFRFRREFGDEEKAVSEIYRAMEMVRLATPDS